MDPEQRIHNQQMLQTYRAVLHEYQLQAATMGIQTPVHVKLEIDRYRRLSAELEPQTNLPWPRHNLPPRNYEQLVGRQRELEQLGKLLDPRGRAYFVAINGIGEIGKSALALETAYRYREALIFARERGGRGNLITFQLRLALLEKERGNIQAALDYAREALEWSQQLGIVKEQTQAAELCALLSS